MIEIKCKDKTYIVEAEDQRSAISKLVEIGIDIVNKERSNIMSSKDNTGHLEEHTHQKSKT